MKELFAFLGRFVRPYRRNLVGSVIFNLLSAFLNVFSFVLIVPILKILFQIEDAETYQYIELTGAEIGDYFDILKNNFYWWVTEFIDKYSASRTLLLLGLILIVMTFFKTACYYA